MFFFFFWMEEIVTSCVVYMCRLPTFDIMHVQENVIDAQILYVRFKYNVLSTKRQPSFLFFNMISNVFTWLEEKYRKSNKKTSLGREGERGLTEC